MTPPGAGEDGLPWDCSDCPSYCCAYAQIVVEPGDVARLARRLGLDEDTATRRLTKPGREAGTRVMRHVRDPVFGTVCRLLDRGTRRCTAHEARPEACRGFPPEARCHYWDFQAAERRYQGDPRAWVRAWNPV